MLENANPWVLIACVLAGVACGALLGKLLRARRQRKSVPPRQD